MAEAVAAGAKPDVLKKIRARRKLLQNREHARAYNDRRETKVGSFASRNAELESENRRLRGDITTIYEQLAALATTGAASGRKSESILRATIAALSEQLAVAVRQST